MLYCYFIARSAPEIEGFPYRTLHAPVEFVRAGDLVAAVRRLPRGTRASPQLMLDHTGVLAEASRRGAVLPLRFGTCFASRGILVRLLAAKGPELLDTLERLEGKAEMGLRLSIPEAEDAASRAAQITAACRPLDSWMGVHRDGMGCQVLDIAHLIHEQDVNRYRERARPHAAEVAGPRPPYHFLPEFLKKPAKSERCASPVSRAALKQIS
jgi:hypothetical protein